MTAGQESYTLTFSHDETVSGEVQKQLMNPVTNEEEKVST
jgi:hypothetical protein